MSYGEIEVRRFSYGPNGTFGELFVNGEFFCYTVERSWLNNEKGKSCIPEGRYKLGLRYSPVVEKGSGGEFKEGYEVTNVPGRSYIMIHPGNTAKYDLEGCIAPGDSLGYVKHEWAVLNSRDTFRKLMNRMEESNDWDIVISHKEYP